MKRIAIVALILLLVSCFVVVFADGFDLGSLDVDELIRMDLKIQEELESRSEDPKGMLYPGFYIAGDGIEPGSYVIQIVRANGGYDYAYVEVYSNYKENKRDDMVMCQTFCIGDEFQVNLREGDALYLEIGIAAYVKR